ncbi:structural maintenance of chromosomes protein 2 [Pavlovales sp. CCMP2436]|nr:structural maintenance of chromosomes protein 2 [Pavlovales sp. CCMP2436]|mmetsp:Transcript_9488/g.23969  ORF Transcript_9488/g.23969 Transcript_9488/m.23969 type:complete len:1211 (-) Transcript_9488:268-3900(-)
MYIEEIIVDGFKSYAVRTVIAGFDRKFNAITGLNGSGKSNILDAICFVLGISNLSQVRAGNLNELVYKQGQAGVTKASVTLVWNNANRENSPVGYEEFNQITVTRQVVIGGRNKYLINGHTAQLSRVQNLFHSVQLNVNNPHFLIMQGRITKVINMKPPEVLGMIEEAAGTRMFEMKREAAVKTIEKKDSKVEEIRKVLDEEITPTLDKLRGERGDYMAYTANSADCERLERLVLAHEYFCAKQATSQGEEGLEALKEGHAAFISEISELLESQREQDEEAASAVAQGDAAGSKETRNLEVDAEALSREVLKANAALGHKREAAARERATADGHLAAAAELEGAAPGGKGKGGKKDSGEADAEAKLKKLTLEHDAATVELKRREATYEGQLGVGTDATANTLAAQEQAASSEAASAASEAKQAAMRAKHLKKELVDAEKAVTSAKRDGEALDSELKALGQEEAEAQHSLEALAHDEKVAASLATEHRRADAIAAEARGKVDALTAKNAGLTFRYSKPEKAFDATRVKGTLAELVRVREPRMALALEVVAGGKLSHVVVDTDATAKLLLEKGSLARRTTFVPLNRISARTLPPAKLEAARRLVGVDSVWSPLALLEFDDSVAPAVAYAFGGALVCADASTARKCAFDPSVGVTCVTLEGDSFSPAGTLTGGSRGPSGEGPLAKTAALNKARQEAAAADATAHALSLQSERAAAAGDEAQRLGGLLQLTSHALCLARERLGASAYGQLLATRDRLQADMDATEAKRASAVVAEANAKARALQLKAEQTEFSADTGAVLAKLKAAIADGKKALSAKAKELEAARQAVSRAELARAAIADEASGLRAQAESCGRDAAALDAEVATLASALKEDESTLASLTERLADHRARVSEQNSRASRARAQALSLGKRVSEKRLEAKKVEQKLARAKKDLEAAVGVCADLAAAHGWIRQEEARFGTPGSDYDFGSRDVGKAAERLRALRKDHEALSKRVNKKALAMFERAEAEHAELTRKQRIIEGDKGKIEAVIATLDRKKKEALEKTWAKVNSDFGSIFGTLLPHSNAKLEPPDGQTIHDGLVIHVALGQTWKSSLLELSGGQRSLVALSLVLALLLFKPAPLYILDEVDAALDLSHTQNIGSMIRKHFTQSQFVVVSLKEGMFNNANVIFRTKFVDGVSTVSRTVLCASEPSDAENARAGKGASKKRPAERAALTLAN